MNVGVPILGHLAAPPGSPFGSRSNTPESSRSPSPVRPAGGSTAGSAPFWALSTEEPDFSALQGRRMVDELSTSTKLKREAAFELLLARSPMQAAALENRHTALTAPGLGEQRSRTSFIRPPQREGLTLEPEAPLSPEERAEQRRARREKLRAYHRRHHDLSPPKPVASPQLKRPTAVRPQAKFSPAGIWASDNSHLKPHEKPSAIACAWAAAQREATEASEALTFAGGEGATGGGRTPASRSASGFYSSAPSPPFKAKTSGATPSSGFAAPKRTLPSGSSGGGAPAAAPASERAAARSGGCQSSCSVPASTNRATKNGSSNTTRKGASSASALQQASGPSAADAAAAASKPVGTRDKSKPTSSSAFHAAAKGADGSSLPMATTLPAPGAASMGWSGADGDASTELLSCDDASSIVSAMAPVRHGIVPGAKAFLSPWGGNPARSRLEKSTQPKHVLLEVMVGQRQPVHMRHPGTLVGLRGRLSRLLSFSETSLKVSAEIEEITAEQAPPMADHPRLMRLRVAGRPLATILDLFFVLLSWIDLVTSILFCVFTLYAPPAPVPYVYASPWPLIPIYAFVRTANEALSAEFLVNDKLREVLQRRSGEVVLLVVTALLGPDTILLLSGISLLPRGVRLSEECNMLLRARAAMIAPLLLDVPMLVINMQYHARTATPYDMLSFVTLGLNAVSLLIHLPWRLARMIGAQRRQADRLELDGSADYVFGEGTSFGWKEPTQDDFREELVKPAAGEGGAMQRTISPMRMMLQEQSSSAQFELKAMRDKTEHMASLMESGEASKDPFDA